MLSNQLAGTACVWLLISGLIALALVPLLTTEERRWTSLLIAVGQLATFVLVLLSRTFA